MNSKTISPQIIERTAPSPTGGLHLGHVYSAIKAYRNARKNLGLFKIRIEDIDFTRCRLDFEQEIIANLSWLGIKWDGQIMRQRKRMMHYASAIRHLMKNGLLYPCSCTRKDINNSVSAPHSEVKSNVVYPGTCRNTTPDKPIKALRLDIVKATQMISEQNLSFFERDGKDENSLESQLIPFEKLISEFGDFIISRKDIGTSYNLAVVVDDAAQMVTHVTRGKDLRNVTPIQVLLQKLLNLPTPIYHHHALLCENSGKKISKRHSPKTVSSLMKQGRSAEEVINMAFSWHKKS